MIKSFADKRSVAIFTGYAVRGLSVQLQRRARVKMLVIDAASQIGNLLVPPGNRLEALRGNWHGQHSICLNDQWQICVVWPDHEALGVEIVDYH